MTIDELLDRVEWMSRRGIIISSTLDTANNIRTTVRIRDPDDDIYVDEATDLGGRVVCFMREHQMSHEAQ